MKIVGLKGVKIKKVHPNAEIPEYMTAGAACFDITAVNIDLRNSIGHSTQYATVRTGLAFEIPEGYKLCIVPRSSFCHKDWIMQNSPAQIDSDYRGEVMLKFQAIPIDTNSQHEREKISHTHNLIQNGFPYSIGDRVAQGYFEKVIQAEFIEVNELNETERSTGGFGSTGN